MDSYFEIQADNTWAILKNPTPQLDAQLFESFKVKAKNYVYDPRFRAGIWDGFERFYDKVQHRMLAGLTQYLSDMGFEMEIVSLALDPLEDTMVSKFELINPNDRSVMTPTSYQQEAFDAVLEGANRGVFDHITASGKSALIAGICKIFPAPVRILITVPNCELLAQTKKDLEIMIGEPIGQLGCKGKDFKPRVIVAYDGFIKQYIKSVFVRDLAQITEVLICDELQTVTKTLYPFFKKLTNAYYRYGLSGSFYDIDPVRIFSTSGYFGGIITSVTDEDTKEQGRTVPPIFHFIEYPIPRTPNDLYMEAYKEQIVLNAQYNDYFAKIISPYYEEGKSILVLVKQVAHCAFFQQCLAKYHVESVQYHGKSFDREGLREGFKSGSIPVMIATEQTMGIGVNVPRIEVLLNLGCGLSDDKTKQKYGRALRSFGGKTEVLILEPYITVNRWFFRHARSRMNMAKNYSTGKVYLLPFENPIPQLQV
jgi:superfamily II DNA or RNA helicase